MEGKPPRANSSVLQRKIMAKVAGSRSASACAQEHAQYAPIPNAIHWAGVLVCVLSHHAVVAISRAVARLMTTTRVPPP